MSQSPEDIKRWTARRKAAAVMDIIKGKTTATELARSHDLTSAGLDGREKQDALRHSCGSYMLATENDMDKLKSDMGHQHMAVFSSIIVKLLQRMRQSHTGIFFPAEVQGSYLLFLLP